MFLHTQNLAVQTFLSTDKNAPILNNQNLAQIFKACLVEGYGEKESAGWSLVYEDSNTGKYVFAPKYNTPLNSFFVQVDNLKTNNEARIQIFKEITNIDTGNKILELTGKFRFGVNLTNQWFLSASDRNLIFGNSSRWQTHYSQNKLGTLLYAGETGQAHDGTSLICLNHTGTYSTWTSLLHSFVIQDSGQNLATKVYDALKNQSFIPQGFVSTFLNEPVYSERFLSPVYIRYNNTLYPMMGLYIHTLPDDNLTEIQLNEQNFVLFNSGTSDPNSAKSIAIKKDSWSW